MLNCRGQIQQQNQPTASACNASVVTTPTISLPKGGGAIRDIGEKFAANLVTGTDSMTVPIATSRGRSGFGPQLNLTYDSGSGNGPFGFGWSLLLPTITRKTDKGLLQYRDSEESDVLLLSCAKDVVPLLKKDADGNWVKDTQGKFVFAEETIGGHRVRRYYSYEQQLGDPLHPIFSFILSVTQEWLQTAKRGLPQKVPAAGRVHL